MWFDCRCFALSCDRRACVTAVRLTAVNVLLDSLFTPCQLGIAHAGHSQRLFKALRALKQQQQSEEDQRAKKQAGLAGVSLSHITVRWAAETWLVDIGLPQYAGSVDSVLALRGATVASVCAYGCVLLFSQRRFWCAAMNAVVYERVGVEHSDLCAATLLC